eukprot:TRINITY_DN4549_c4_g1_i1.p1 TRINITY_DN4549_c4_g1~~TRINITY_DN4549_c4_g1_i1.p1  ORF type:complete len:517 (+),score=51.75 TRINITY_DN4549_c4_g1_i1:28-1551(+)
MPPFLETLDTKCRDEECNKLVAKSLTCIASYTSPEKYLKPALTKRKSIEAELMAVLLGLSGGNAEVLPKSITVIDELISRYRIHGTNTEREEGLLSCVRSWAKGDLVSAITKAELTIKKFPLDFLALRILCDARIILGQPEAYLSILQYVEPHWRNTKFVIEHSYVLGMLAFGLQECGYLKECRNAARKSLQGGAKDSWAIHAVVHSYTAEGKPALGLQYLNATAEIWQRSELLAEHLWWHSGINHLDVSKPNRAMFVYDRHLGGIEPASPPTTAFTLSDSVGLLWRVYLMDPSRLSELCPRAKILCSGARIGGHDEAKVWAFTACHVFAGAVLAGDDDLRRTVMVSMEHAVEAGTDFGEICKVAALPICKGLQSHAEGDFATAAEQLRTAKIFKIGGSSAQRDTFTFTLFDTLVRSGSSEALHLAQARSRENPFSPLLWLVRANAEAANKAGGAFDRTILNQKKGRNRAADMSHKLEAEAERQILGGGMYQLARKWRRPRKVQAKL